jgi:hypothetical protein
MSNDAPIPTQGNQPLSDATRNYVWQGLLDGVRYVRYYGALHQRYNRRHQIFRFMLGLAGVCTVLPLVPLIPSIVASFSGLFVVGLLVWELVHGYGPKAAALRVASEGMSDLEVQWRTLWEESNHDSLTTEAAGKQTVKLQEATQRLVRGVDIHRDNDLNERCQKESFQSEEYRYSAG